MSRTLALVAALLCAVARPGPAHAWGLDKSVMSLTVMSASGDETSPKFLPAPLQRCLKQYPSADFRREMGVRAPALVLAMLQFPSDERDLRVGSAVVGAAGGSRPFCEDVPGVVALGVTDLDHRIELQVQKLGYRTVRTEILAPRIGNTLIWLGTIPMERVNPTVEALWSLPLVDAQGLPASYTELPVAFYDCLEQLETEQFRTEAGVRAPAMLLALMEFPEDEADPSILPTLTGTERGWRRYCAEVPGAVALSLTEFDQPVGLRVEKLGYETVRATLPIDASAGNTIIWLGRLPMKRRDPSAKSAWSLSVIDARGEPIDHSQLPEAAYRCLRQLSVDDFRDDIGSKTPSMVLASLQFPEGERDIDVGPSLRGARRGWARFCTTERTLAALAFIDADQPVELRVEKAGYQPLRVPVPLPPAGNTLIWLGPLAMEPAASYHATEISGEIVNGRHRIADMVDRVTIQMRQTTRRQACNLSNTSFVCQPVTPGDYLVEFWRGSGLVHTWWVTVPDDLTPIHRTFVAKTTARLPATATAWPPGAQPPQQLLLELRDEAQIITLPNDAWLHVSQIGPVVQFASAEHPLAVCQGPLQGFGRLGRCLAEARVRPAGESWTGFVQPGDVVALLDAAGRPFAALEILGYDWVMRLEP